MKKIIFAFLLLALGVSEKSFTQNVQEYRVPASVNAIPPAVLKTFNDQYRGVKVQGWYVTHISYWFYDVSSGWYYDWYGQRTVVVYTYSEPNYYEVEFIAEPGELSRAVYSKYGFWFETRTQIKGLPKPILDSLSESKYANWKISPLKERIESAYWPDPVYRFKVSKGIRSVIIRMDENGNIVQRKDLS